MNSPSSLPTGRSHGLTRRSVVGTAAWSAPAIVAGVAAPAFAAASTTLVPSFDTNSFRANNTSGLFNNNPNAGPVMAIAVNVQVLQTGVPTLRCVLTAASGQTLSFLNIFSTIERGGTTWSSNNGALGASGWSPTPGLPGNATLPFVPTSGAEGNSFTFERGASVSAGTTVSLRITMGNVGNADFPLSFQFSAPGSGTPTPAPFVVNVGDVDT